MVTISSSIYDMVSFVLRFRYRGADEPIVGSMRQLINRTSPMQPPRGYSSSFNFDQSWHAEFAHAVSIEELSKEAVVVDN